jgi:hypothetical protein
VVATYLSPPASFDNEQLLTHKNVSTEQEIEHPLKAFCQQPKLLPEMTLLLLISLTVIALYDPTAALYQCTPQQAKNVGAFKCLSNCDENHIAQGQYGPKKYCLNYFPNGGSCYMKPYTRTEIFSCNGKAGGSNPPMWIIMVGGSNMFMMVKTLIDKMLNLPGNAGYNPAKYWGAQSTSDVNVFAVVSSSARGSGGWRPVIASWQSTVDNSRSFSVFHSPHV